MFIFPILGKVAVSLLMSLATESFIKSFVLAGLEWAAKQSENEVDDKIVESVRQAWQTQK
jgi:hypothetical protein